MPMKRRTLGRHVLLAALVLAAVPHVVAQDTPIDLKFAQRCFQEAHARSDADGGRLWGVELYGPMLLVDRVSRAVVGNMPDAEGRLMAEGDVYVGCLSNDVGIANTATEWAGRRWTMLIWPLSEDSTDRARLMVHELFHRVQDDIGLPASSPMCNHLDSRDGRIWLRLEWRALARALTSEGAERTNAVRDALLFRARRYALFPDGAALERALEMNEGLAEYTGVKLCGFSEPRAREHAAARLRGEEQGDKFVRSFAYASGPAYGLLLDAAGTAWRKNLKPDTDLGGLLRAALHIRLPDDIARAAEERSASYGGAEVVAAETAREEARKRRLAEYRKRYFESPVLVLPLSESLRYGFNPQAIEAYDDNSNVYHTATVRDEWGILNVTGGALLVRRDGRLAEARVPVPRDPQARPIAGDGWTLELKEGWRLAPGVRAGDYKLVGE